MSLEEQLLALIGTGGLVGLITAFITMRNFNQSHTAQYIIDERRKWRNEIREELVRVSFTSDTDTIRNLYTFMNIRLNPYDKEDQIILHIIHDLYKNPNDNQKWNELQDRIAILLKHDWERVKQDVNKSFPYFKFGIIFVLLVSVYVWVSDKQNLFEIKNLGIALILYIVIYGGYSLYKILKKGFLSYKVENCLKKTNYEWIKKHPFILKYIIDRWNIRNNKLRQIINSHGEKEKE